MIGSIDMVDGTSVEALVLFLEDVSSGWVRVLMRSANLERSPKPDVIIVLYAHINRDGINPSGFREAIPKMVSGSSGSSRKGEGEAATAGMTEARNVIT